MGLYETWFEKNRERIISDYITYLKFPSISAQKNHNPDTLACAKWVENYLKKLGFTTTEWTNLYANADPNAIPWCNREMTVIVNGHTFVGTIIDTRQWSKLVFV